MVGLIELAAFRLNSNPTVFAWRSERCLHALTAPQAWSFASKKETPDVVEGTPDVVKYN